MMYNDHVPTQRLQFIIESDPDVLQHESGNGQTPLHQAALAYVEKENDDEWFFSLLQAGIKKYPTMKGIMLLFQKAGAASRCTVMARPTREFNIKYLSLIHI